MKSINQTLYDKVKMSLKLSDPGEVISIHHMLASQVHLINKSANYEAYCENVKEVNNRVNGESEFAKEIYLLPVKLADIMREVKAIREILERVDLKV